MHTITTKQLTDEYNRWIHTYDYDATNEAGQYFGQYIMGKYNVGAGNSYFLKDPFEAMTEIIVEAPRGMVIYSPYERSPRSFPKSSPVS